jgi:uncharacterized protein YjiS (DUF1127 family)
MEDAMTQHAETWRIVPELLGRAIVTLAGNLAVRVRNALQAAKHRRDLAVLASFDDRMLADIGLTRSDLREAFSEPLWRDPTALLVSRVYRRRSRLRPVRVVAPPIVPQTGASQVTRRAA